MAAVLLSLALFTFWGVVGYALVPLALPRHRAVPNLLLAPVVGLALTELPLYLLNRAGLPIGHVGWPVTACLLLAAVGLLLRFRPPLPLRRAAPFAFLLVASLLLVGWPMLRFGFDWISFGNDDMANYCLGGDRFLRHGFGDVPTAADLFEGRDTSQWWWFMFVPGQVRPGSDMLLAWVASLTGLSTLQVSMPVLLALHLALVSAAGTLLYRRSGGRRAALMVCALLAVSSALALGVFYQLIAQVGGLALLCGGVAVFLRPVRRLPAAAVVRFGLLAGIVLAGQLLHYPEAIPFLGLGFLARAGLDWYRRRLRLTATAAAAGAAGLVALGLLGSYFVGSLVFLLTQAGNGMSGSAFIVELFPYYLVPEGLASLWGFQSVFLSLSEPWLSAAIMAGALLLLGALIAAAWLGLRGHAVALLGGITLTLGLTLFARRAGFGLFKLAMYGQPFLLGTLALAWVRLPRCRWACTVVLALLALANVKAQQQLARASLGDTIMCEIRGGSAGRPVARFREQLREQPAEHLLFDIPSTALGKLLTLHTHGKAVSMACVNYFVGIERFGDFRCGGAASSAIYDRLDEELDRRTEWADFQLHDPNEPSAVNTFKRLLPAAVPGRTVLVGTPGDQTIVNRHHYPAGTGDFFFLRPLDQVHNHLIFVSSKKGRHLYDASEARQIAMFQLEADVLLHGRTFTCLGRHILFEVLNPSPRLRLELDFTASLKCDGLNRLPPAAAIGTRRVALPLVGTGSARVFSPPLVPQKIGGRSYVALDMGAFGTRFANIQQRGLAKLWGQDLMRDRRYIVGFGRNISAVSEEEYNRLTPPRLLATFPRDLTNPAVEYSGIYEDGWISESAWCMLSHPCGDAVLTFKGHIPDTGKAYHRCELVVRVDGREVGRRGLGTGAFDLRWPVPAGAGRRRVELRFSAGIHLPKGDDRPVAAFIEKLGFEQEAAPLARH